MGDEWKIVPLGQLYDFSSGLSKPRSAFGSGYPFLGFKDVFYNSSVPSLLTELVNSTEQERSRCSIKRGDVFVTRTSETMDELGMSCVALRDACNATFNGFTKRLRPKDPDIVIPEYARYYFRAPTFRQAVTAMSSLSTRASLNNEMLERLFVVLPPAKEQEAIGHILGTLDDKIELNRRMNETLEAMAQALFKSWFVDFDPVRAKAEGRDPGLPRAIAELFPDSCEQTELGEIPRGWGTRLLGDIFILDKGLSYKGRFLTEDGVPMVNLGCFLGRGRFSHKAIKKYSGEYKERHIVRPLDLVLANTDITQQREVIGSPAIVPPQENLNALIFSHHVFAARFREDTEFWKLFVYFLMLQNDFRSRATGFATGTTVLALPRDAIQNARLPGAPQGLVVAFSEIVLPILEKGWQTEQESRSLATLRDILLPKLISGELQVRDAEKNLAAIT